MTINPYQSPRSEEFSPPAALDDVPLVPSWTLGGAALVYLVFNAVCTLSAHGSRDALALFGLAVTPSLIVLLLLVQCTARPFRWRAVQAAAMFLVVMASLNVGVLAMAERARRSYCALDVLWALL